MSAHHVTKKLTFDDLSGTRAPTAQRRRGTFGRTPDSSGGPRVFLLLSQTSQVRPRGNRMRATVQAGKRKKYQRDPQEAVMSKCTICIETGGSNTRFSPPAAICRITRATTALAKRDSPRNRAPVIAINIPAAMAMAGCRTRRRRSAGDDDDKSAAIPAASEVLRKECH